MESDNNPDGEDRQQTYEAESEYSSTSGPAERPDQQDFAMTTSTPRKELKQLFDRNQLIRRNIDMSLDVVLRTNPAENILKNIDDDELADQSRDQVQSMMNGWLDMYRDLLEEGRTLLRDLIERSAELAEETRKSEPRVSPSSRSGRR